MLPLLLGGAAVGGITAGMQAGSNQAINEANLAYAREKSARDEALQREFAQSGIQWRAEDARKAGIHPLAAIGGAGAMYNPSAISLPAEQPSPWLDFANNMGQNLTRSAMASAKVEDRQAIQMNALKVQEQTLRNELLAGQVQLQQQSMLGPAMPSPEEGKMHPDMTYTRTKDGGLAPVPSEQFADRAEDQIIPQIMWGARNLFMPIDPDQKPKPGHSWVYSPLKSEFEEKPDGEKITGWEKARRWFNEK